MQRQIPHVSPQTDGLRYAWQVEYRDALIEFDPIRMVERIATAEAKIAERKETMALTSHDPLEWQALQDAVQTLSVLKQGLR